MTETETDYEFTDLMRRLREGSQEAAREVYDRYFHYLRRVVRNQLHKKLRSIYDSTDFVQEAWTSFFLNQFPHCDFDQPEQLLAYVSRIARRKVMDAHRQRLEGCKYNCALERPLDSTLLKEVGEPLARQPTPSQIVMAEEQMENLVRGKPAHYRQILEMLMEGKTHVQIAQEMGLCERTIRRLVRQWAEPQTP